MRSFYVRLGRGMSSSWLFRVGKYALSVHLRRDHGDFTSTTIIEQWNYEDSSASTVTLSYDRDGVLPHYGLRQTTSKTHR